MFDRIQERARKRRKNKFERELEEKQREKESKENESKYLQQRRTNIESEKERLLSLDEKALKVELIIAVRGLYSQIDHIEEKQQLLSDSIDEIEINISELESKIMDLENAFETVNDNC